MIAPPSPVTLDSVLDTLIEVLEALVALTTEVPDSTTGDGNLEVEGATGDCVVAGGASVLLGPAVENISVGAWANIDEMEISFCEAAYMVESVYEVVRNPVTLVNKKGAPE